MTFGSESSVPPCHLYPPLLRSQNLRDVRWFWCVPPMTSRDVPEKGRVSVYLCLQSRLPFPVAQVLGGRLAAGTWVSAVSAPGAWGVCVGTVLVSC